MHEPDGQWRHTVAGERATRPLVNLIFYFRQAYLNNLHKNKILCFTCGSVECLFLQT